MSTDLDIEAKQGGEHVCQDVHPAPLLGILDAQIRGQLAVDPPPKLAVRDVPQPQRDHHQQQGYSGDGLLARVVRLGSLRSPQSLAQMQVWCMLL